MNTNAETERTTNNDDVAQVTMSEETLATPIPTTPKKVVKKKPIRLLEDLIEAPTKGMCDKEKDKLIAHLREQIVYLENKIGCLDGSFKEMVQAQRAKEAAQFKALQDYRQCVNTLVQSISNSNNVANMAINMLKTDIGKEN